MDYISFYSPYSTSLSKPLKVHALPIACLYTQISVLLPSFEWKRRLFLRLVCSHHLKLHSPLVHLLINFYIWFTFESITSGPPSVESIWNPIYRKILEEVIFNYNDFQNQIVSLWVYLNPRLTAYLGLQKYPALLAQAKNEPQ